MREETIFPGIRYPSTVVNYFMKIEKLRKFHPIHRQLTAKKAGIVCAQFLQCKGKWLCLTI